jgi:hypothetical protein
MTERVQSNFGDFPASLPTTGLSTCRSGRTVAGPFEKISNAIYQDQHVNDEWYRVATSRQVVVRVEIIPLNDFLG